MRTFSVSFFAGVLTLFRFHHLPSVQALPWVGVGAMILILAARFICHRRRRAQTPTLLLAGLVLGALYALFTASHVRMHWLPENWEGRDKLLSGVIADIPEQKPDGLRFLLDVDDPAFSGRLRIAWYADDLPAIRAGERWQFLLRGKRPNGFMNPGGFDYEQWLFSQRIAGSGYVRESPLNRRLQAASTLQPDNLRQGIKERIQQVLGDSPVTGLVQGLAVAYRGEIPSSQWDVLRATGTSHLLAISGLHIGMAAGAGFLPVLLLWRLRPTLYLFLPARVAGGMLGAVFACAYALLAGFNIPTQRALIMVLTLMLSLFMRRRIPFSVALSLALLLVLLLDPLAPLSAGFWLSFLAVSLLVWLGSRRLRQGKWALFGIQIALSLGMMPLSAGFFGSVSLVSPLANLLAIPLVTLLIAPLILSGVLFDPVLPWLSAGLWELAAWLLSLLFHVLEWLAGLPFASFYLPHLPLAWILTGLAGVSLLLLPRGVPGRWLGGILVLPLFFYHPPGPETGAFRVTVLDVGQGLASTVQTAHHTLIFDTGPKASDSFDTGELVMLPWLRGQGLRHIDRLIVSHADNDHSGGAAAILANIPVDEVWGSDPQTLPRQHMLMCQAGQHWNWDGVEFTVLHPSSYYTDAKRNNRSCVLRVSNSHHSLLLTADIERPAEQWIIHQQSGTLTSEVLLTPHHGSKTSSSIDFIQAVSPRLAIVTTGYRNRFHHPHPSVMARYKNRQIQVLNTAVSGAILLDFPASPHAYKLTAWRDKNHHVWNH